MIEELKKEILDILDNVYYWETCPQEYNDRIDAVKKQLTIPVVVKSFYCDGDNNPMEDRCEEQCWHCRSIE